MHKGNQICVMTVEVVLVVLEHKQTQLMGPTWGPSGADRTQVGPMLATWTLLLGLLHKDRISFPKCLQLIRDSEWSIAAQMIFFQIGGWYLAALWFSSIITRTTRTPAFWGYPPPPHDYPYYWQVHFESQVYTIDQFISDPKSKQDESQKIWKICGKFKIL